MTGIPRRFRYLALAIVLGGCAPGSFGGNVLTRGPAAAPPVAEVPPAPPPALMLPKAWELLGESRTLVTARLGKAQLVRHETGAEVWQYRGAACVLYLYFYPSEVGAPEETFKVAQVDARAATSAATPAVTQDDCFAGLMEKRNNP